VPRKKLDTITREEFDRRLDAYNERMRLELQQKEAELAQVEQLLTQYENMLDEIEARSNSREETPSYPAVLRKRLQELAVKTAEMAASL
jgi:hypothetical protein